MTVFRVLLLFCAILCVAACTTPVDELLDEETVDVDTTAEMDIVDALPEIDTTVETDIAILDDDLPDQTDQTDQSDPSDPSDNMVLPDNDTVAPVDADGPVCWEPEVLIAIDRTLSMRTAVNGVTKWDMARQAITAIVNKFTDTIHFGLEFFPKTVDGCFSIAEIEAGSKVSNVNCLEGEIAIPPAFDTDELINTTMESAKLCKSTPIKSALLSARDFYVAHPPTPAARKQFVILLSDGKETCEKATLPCGAQELLAAGVKTYVVGFGGAVNPDYLNHLVCAGGTAPDPNACLTGATSGCTEAYLGIDPLYFTAEDGDQLLLQLDEIAAKLAECQS